MIEVSETFQKIADSPAYAEWTHVTVSPDTGDITTIFAWILLITCVTLLMLTKRRK